ncbi:hypothetical protein AJ80_06473 [Polytolypa hystricis UAMH7299]|uniref:Protein sym1 n=1 Tax=Polytolypa hystricis (strain UAMH7299) TaxID=1447883 RepID=A0A2B7XWF4_POLH7|nr:hypothetical protein AJ80_06473 [Polytolypa hystricis UAMH7299]
MQSHDFMRTLRLGIYGGGIFGPVAARWYTFLQRRVVLSRPAATTVARVAMDQVLFTPVSLSMFFGVTSLMEGKNPVEKIKSNLWSTYKLNLMLWPWAQLANFALIPPQHRLLFVNVLNIGE